jgi:transposase-like protein
MIYFHQNNPKRLAEGISLVCDVFKKKNIEGLHETHDVMEFMRVSGLFYNNGYGGTYAIMLPPRTSDAVPILEEKAKICGEIEEKTVRQYHVNNEKKGTLARLAKKAEFTRAEEEQRAERERKRAEEDKAISEQCLKEVRDDENKYIASKKEYVIECMQYLHMDESACKFSSQEEIDAIMIRAHQTYNTDLVSKIKFKGCNEMGFRCDCDMCHKGECSWKVGDIKCSCGHYAGFTFDTDHVVWLNEVNLHSKSYAGYQERLW